ncbi:hypothetical protein [Streptomyces fragilis]|uniref:Uncharacterized protein n=1 Tax=Streptomyces fragilis TaxID=67301 RepID=A0ABV2YCA7_9ACTN|nr:hypothetical protein [Streptomyces fragilis]
MTPSTPDQLRDLARRLRESMQEFTLLDDTGHIPDPPPHSDLLHHLSATHQHLLDSLALARAETTAGDLDRPPGTRERLALAASHALAASFLFGHALHKILTHPHLKPHEAAVTLDHASARAELRRCAETLEGTAALLEEHESLREFIASMRPPGRPEQRPGPTR